jgi:hypothetical protein
VTGEILGRPHYLSYLKSELDVSPAAELPDTQMKVPFVMVAYEACTPLS